MKCNQSLRRISSVILIVVFALSFVTAYSESEASSIGVIGGADGPTAIYLSSGGSLQEAIEKQLPSLMFTDMPKDAYSAAIEALGDIAPAYSFIGRATTDNRYGYIVGVLTAEESPLLGTGCSQTFYPDGTMRTIITRGDSDTPVFEVGGATLNYSSTSPIILHVTPASYRESDFNVVINILISGDFAYLSDTAARGVTLCAPQPPYLNVNYYVNGRYRSECIALTAEDVMNSMLCSTIYLPEDIGEYAICLVNEGDDPHEAYMRNAPIAASLLELAKQRCGFVIGSPDDITRIASASMTVTAFGESRTQVITNRGVLDRLTDILRSAEPTQLGGCPYTGVLTLTMEDGGTVTVQKATDSCGTMLFGSMRCYKIERSENEAFWEIFREAYSLITEQALL